MRLDGEEASKMLLLSAYLDPSELHKLLERRERQKQRKAAQNASKGTSGNDGIILTEFDKLALDEKVSLNLMPCFLI